MHPDSFISIDETCLYFHPRPQTGYAKKGHRLHVPLHQRRHDKYTLMLAVSSNGVMGWQVLRGSGTSSTFATFINSLPCSPQTHVLLDNVAFHKSRVVQEAFATKVSRGIRRGLCRACPPLLGLLLGLLVLLLGPGGGLVSEVIFDVQQVLVANDKRNADTAAGQFVHMPLIPVVQRIYQVMAADVSKAKSLQGLVLAVRRDDRVIYAGIFVVAVVLFLLLLQGN
jgi:hypothetical protein